MAKLVHAASGQTAPQEIAARQKASDTVVMTNDVSAGATELFYRRRWKYYYLPYSEMIWAYRQVAQSHVTLGCCGGVIQEFRVIMRPSQGEDVMVWFERESEAIRLMEIIHEKNPDCAQGFTAENKKRFGVKK